MGLLGNLIGAKKPEETGAPEAQAPQGKYDELCSICGKGGTEKKWAGKYWHKKCFRMARRSAKGMI